MSPSAFDDEVRGLLGAYQRVRANVAGGGSVVSVRTGRHSARGPRRVVLWGLDDHVTRRAALLRRGAHADSAATGADHSGTLGALDHLLASLPPVPYRRLYAALVLLVSAASLGVIAILRSFEGTKALSRTLGAANDLVDKLSTRVLTIDVGQIPDALKDLGGAGDARVLAFVAIIVLLSLYAVLRPFTPSFRIRHELLRGEIAAHETRLLAAAPARDAVRPDRVRAADVAPAVRRPLHVSDGLARADAATALVGLLLLAGPATARLAYLWRAWRRRTRAEVERERPETARFAPSRRAGFEPCPRVNPIGRRPRLCVPSQDRCRSAPSALSTS